MKKITLALSLVSLILIYACGEDPLTIEEQLKGDWTRSSLEIKDCDDPEDNFIKTDTNTQGCLQLNDDTYACSLLEFFEGGTGEESSIVNGDFDINPLTYTIEESTGRITVTNIDGDEFEAILDGITLSFTFDNDEGCTIIAIYEQ